MIEMHFCILPTKLLHLICIHKFSKGVHDKYKRRDFLLDINSVAFLLPSDSYR